MDSNLRLVGEDEQDPDEGGIEYLPRLGSLALKDFIILEANEFHPDLLAAKYVSDRHKRWKEVALSLRLEGAFMPSLRVYVDFLKALEQGTRLFDGTGTSISGVEALRLYADIKEKGRPYRSEWIDAYFKLGGGKRTKMPVCSNQNSKITTRIRRIFNGK